MNKTIALIPARIGSKRIHRKNMQTIGEQTLVDIAIRTALDCPTIDQVIVTTDDYEIGKIATDNEVECVRRPVNLAGDDVEMMDVVRHALQGLKFDQFVLLQPTSPLRTDQDIVAAVELMEQAHADGVVSLAQHLAPGEYFRLVGDNRMAPVHATVDVYTPNGAIFGLTIGAFNKGHDWWTAHHVVGYLMPEERSIDIDTPADLERARALWTKRTKMPA